jgi:hypothetical protein
LEKEKQQSFGQNEMMIALMLDKIKIFVSQWFKKKEKALIII